MRNIAILLAIVVASGCSLVVESDADQCQTNDDCARFEEHAICQQGVCVATGLGPMGCFFGDPQNDEDLLNQCSAATCEAFDNCERLKLCDDQLPELLPPPGR